MRKITETFMQNIASVENLIHFDREVLEIAIKSIKKLRDRLVNGQKITNNHLNGTSTINVLESIRKNDSLKSKYSVINNQAVVLLVSYFGSAVADLFRESAQYALEAKGEEAVINSEFKFKISELLRFSNSPGESIGDILISKVGISFQDMKSIQREFKRFFSIEIERDENVNNIILGHACRHTIAHEAGIVNSRVINQISSATPRTLKITLWQGEDVSFSEEEIGILSASMLTYIVSLENKVSLYKSRQ